MSKGYITMLCKCEFIYVEFHFYGVHIYGGINNIAYILVVETILISCA